MIRSDGVSILVRVLRIALALLVLGAIGWQLRIHLSLSYSAVNFFSYFTNLSNLFAAGVLLFVAMSRDGDGNGDCNVGAGARHDLVRYLATVNMLIVGIVFAVLLRDVDLGALWPWINVLLHDVMPVAMLLDWLLVPPRRALAPRSIAIALVFPAAYLAYVVVRGAASGWYPYPFLDPARVGGPAAVVAYASAIAVAFLLAAWALRAFGNRRAMSRPTGPRDEMVG